MSPEANERRNGPTPAVLLVGLIVLATALRFWRLGNWGFDSDETFTLRDSLNPTLSNPRPLLFFLNYYVVRPLMPLDELGLRLLPAVFGVLAIPTFYLVARRLVGTRAALFGALLLAVSGLHVYYSQFARYWSLVFLLSAVYPYAMYLGLRERNPRALALGLLTAVVAIAAHPASGLLLGGLGLWIVLAYLRRDHFTRLWGQRRVRWAAVVLGLLVVALAVRFTSLLEGWISSHDQKPGNTNEFLLHLPGTPGVKQLAYLLGFAESLTLPLVLAAGLGIYLLWRERDRSLAILLTCMFIFPEAFLVLLSFRTPVGVYYLVPTLPIVFIGAGVFLDRLTGIDWGLHPRWLLPAAMTAMIIAAGAPTLLSQYRDGRRYDFRGAALWLHERIAPGDVVFSDQFKVLTYYLPGAQINKLGGDPAPLVQSLRIVRQTRPGGTVWVVAPAPSHAFRTNPKIGSLNGWLYSNCQLRNTIGVGRLDFRQYHLQVYRCPPAVSSPEAVSKAE